MRFIDVDDLFYQYLRPTADDFVEIILQFPFTDPRREQLIRLISS